ncbi:hypothetical protein BDA99DRAFT_567948 [Phascolomyces articulosus]|uniref:Uncharacterized protein n=1 Tax=Phascolomyces articulosus TaxID=60185 RepID=A0AAD5PJB8_9FUNG|nr:hypothetical protein BDA99DRAFT_567948 [Phascolomyces articulosus]
MYAPEEPLAMSTSDMDIGRMVKNLHEKLENAENEKLNLQEQLLESIEKQSELAIENERLHKRMASLQQDINIYINNQARFEEDHCTQDQELTDLRKEVTQLTKVKNDLQNKLKSELDTSENNQLKWLQREEELCRQVRQLTEIERCHQKNKVSAKRSSVSSSSKKVQNQATLNTNNKEQKSTEAFCSSPTLPSSSSARRTCSIRSSYERQVTDLKQQLKTQETRLVKEMAEQDRRQSRRIKYLETEISNIKQINQSLMEENEGYQVLLNEQSMNGSLLLGDPQQIHTIYQDLTNTNNPMTETTTSGFNLAAELHNLSSKSIHETDGGGAKMQQQQQTNAELYKEIKSLKDSNHALNLYLNKILAKIVDNEDLEYLLSIDHQHQQHTSMSTPTSQQVNNSKINKTKASSLNQIHDGPSIMRKSFSSTMLSKIIRRKQHTDQQITLKIQGPTTTSNDRQTSASLTSTPLGQSTVTSTVSATTTISNATTSNVDEPSRQKQNDYLKKQRISLDMEDNNKSNNREKITSNRS